MTDERKPAPEFHKTWPNCPTCNKPLTDPAPKMSITPNPTPEQIRATHPEYKPSEPADYRARRDSAADLFDQTCGAIDLEDVFKAGADWIYAEVGREHQSTIDLLRQRNIEVERLTAERDQWRAQCEQYAKLEREAVRVYSTSDHANASWSVHKDRRVLDRNAPDTHTALLIGIKPIVKDTAEGLIREMLRLLSSDEAECVNSWEKRARKLLAL